MFERFTEQARRAIFFGRHEASRRLSKRIETEHLLLGLLRDDKRGVSQLPESDVIAIRQRVEQGASERELGGVSVDLPLSDECKLVLRLGTKEADALQHKTIDTPHLLLGMLRVEECTAAKLLREFGMDYGQYREALRAGSLEEPRIDRISERPIERTPPWSEAPSPAAAPALELNIRALENLLDTTVAYLHAYSISYGEQRLKRKDWTRKEAFGHLIDWAMAHQQWLARALTESKVTVSGYPDEAEVAIQGYADFPWWETVDLWVMLNWLLVHVIRRIPEAKLNVPCRIGMADPISLAELVTVYVQHCEDIVGQVLAHL
ncbi:MAG: Clp protease N-terminal domain-containing protein [Bryobacteraceae bacterium]